METYWGLILKCPRTEKAQRVEKDDSGADGLCILMFLVVVAASHEFQLLRVTI